MGKRWKSTLISSLVSYNLIMVWLVDTIFFVISTTSNKNIGFNVVKQVNFIGGTKGKIPKFYWFECKCHILVKLKHLFLPRLQQGSMQWIVNISRWWSQQNLFLKTFFFKSTNFVHLLHVVIVNAPHIKTFKLYLYITKLNYLLILLHGWYDKDNNQIWFWA